MTTDNELGWYLEGRLEGEKIPRRFTLRGFPALIGRTPSADVSLADGQVSSKHAQIKALGDELWVEDLGSSNGTYVNRIPIEAPARLDRGDVIHIASVELLVGRESDTSEDLAATCVMAASPQAVPTGTHSRARVLETVLKLGAVRAEFQPIVSLTESAPPAYEALGRGAHKDLPESPGPLFEIAAESGLGAELSRAFRFAAFRAACTLPDSPRIYTNLHPDELIDERIVRELEAVRRHSPSLPITVEVHESTVTEPAAMRALHASLSDLDVKVAYDDFGAGQARLLELSDCPPDCLKFDISLIEKLHEAPESRQRMIESLVRICKDMGVTCLAEGVERAGELAICQQLGFDLAQGYFIARPASVSTWRTPWRWIPPAPESIELDDPSEAVTEVSASPQTAAR